MNARCDSCRFWLQTRSGFEYDADRMIATGDCSRIVASPARRKTGGRLAPANSGAWLQTYADFYCGEHQSVQQEAGQ